MEIDATVDVVVIVKVVAVVVDVAGIKLFVDSMELIQIEK